MLGDGKGGGHGSNRLAAHRFREATAEERATYRKWLRGTIVFYGALLLASGVVAMTNYSSVGLKQLAKPSVRQAAVSPPRPD